MVAAFGWSAGDIATAIKVVWKIVEAFNQSRGAAQKYAASSQFLRALVPVLERIAEIQADKADVIHEAVTEQAITIWSSFVELENYFEKRHGLSTRNDSTVRKVVDTIKWTLDEMNDRIQKMKAKVLDAMAIMENLLVLDVRQKVQVILEDVKFANETGGQNSAALAQTSQILTEIRDHIESLERVAGDYQAKLQTMDTKQESQSRDEAEQISNRLVEIEKSQKELTQSLNELNQHIIEQSNRTVSEEEQAKWSVLQRETAQQTDELNRMQVDNQELIAKTQTDLNAATTLLDGTADITGRQDMRSASTKLGGAGKLFSVLGPASGGLLGKFGKKSSQSDDRGQMTRSQPARDHSMPVQQRPEFNRRPRARVPIDPKYIPPPPPMRRIPNVRTTSDTQVPVTGANSDLPEDRPPLPARPQTVVGMMHQLPAPSRSLASPRSPAGSNVSPRSPHLNNMSPPPTPPRPALPPRRSPTITPSTNLQASPQSPPHGIPTLMPTPLQLVRTASRETTGSPKPTVDSDYFTAPVPTPRSPPKIPAKKAFPVTSVRSPAPQENTKSQSKTPVVLVSKIEPIVDNKVDSTTDGEINGENLSFAAKLKMFGAQPLMTS